jgi:hypothetical protein
MYYQAIDKWQEIYLPYFQSHCLLSYEHINIIRLQVTKNRSFCIYLYILIVFL